MTDYQGEWNGVRPEENPPARDERIAGASYAHIEQIKRAAAEVRLFHAEQRGLDSVDLASMDSFPCSDPPGHGHA